MEYPQPPPLITKYIDSVLRENQYLLQAAKSFESVDRLGESLSFLERVHSNVIHMGKLADIQTLKHGIPPIETNLRNKQDCGLSPRDELLQTVAMSLLAYHLKPESEVSSTNASSTVMNITESSSTKDTLSSSSSSSFSSTAPLAATTSSSSKKGTGIYPSSTATASSTKSTKPSSSAKGSKGKGAESDTDQETTGTTGTTPSKGGTRWANSRSKWTVQEISKFEEGIVLYGENHPLSISNYMGTRSSEQVRERIKMIKRRLGLAKGGAKRKGETTETGGVPTTTGSTIVHEETTNENDGKEDE